ncbi:Uncharacterised protein [Mycolicibacterium gilvum]|uniref:Cellulose synthase subunit n=1 Tax=Mycolicibacterium gilvum TaxID=1804 RepID=A0A378SV33_9MYCO|nr:hypothetical protein [Mycolicibacterium gilvum]STZ45724.1 Uncharacterised protein [Mycolicibacterium gilvum]
MKRRGIRVLSAMLILVAPSLSAGLHSGVAHAQPDVAAEAAAAPGLRLPWRALGLEPETFLGADSSTSFVIPVPPGLTPTRLQGLVHAPMNIESSFLEVKDGDGRFLAAVDLPRASSAQAVTPLDVDISAAQVRAEAADLTLTVRPLDNADQFCGPLQQVHISDLATVFTGAESSAATIANFFPPVLERAVIYAPDDADSAEQQAALTLASTVTQLYRPQPVEVRVVNHPRGATPPPAGQLGRAVVVETGGQAGLDVRAPGSPGAYLRVAGQGDELSTQVSLLVNQLQSLVQTASSRIDAAGSVEPARLDSPTFGQLGMTGRTDVLRTGSLRVATDRSTLGGRIDKVTVNLKADYTPVPTDDSASVVIRSDDVVVYRTALDNSGRLDATFDMSSQTFGQWLNLDFALTYTPQESCGPFIAPITFQVDPQSTLTISRGGPPLHGFGAVPSEFSPRFLVAFDGSSPNQLAYAAAVVVSISRLTGAPLLPRVVDLKTAVDAKAGALIVARTGALKESSLSPPLSGEGSSVEVGLPVELRADFEDGLGSIQAFADRPRDRSVVLITTTDAWPLVDPLFNYLGQLEGGWSALTGDVLAAGTGGDPTNVAIRDAADPSQGSAVEQGTHTDFVGRWAPVGVAVLIAVSVAAIAAYLWSRRRRAATVNANGSETSDALEGRS